MIETQVVPVEVQQIADEVEAAINGNPTSFATVEGETSLIVHLEAGRFSRLTLKATTCLVPSRQRFSIDQIKRLARDARAKILSEASAIDPKVNVVIVRIHSRGQGYVISLGVER